MLMGAEEFWLHVDAWVYHHHDVYVGSRLLVGT